MGAYLAAVVVAAYWVARAGLMATEALAVTVETTVGQGALEVARAGMAGRAGRAGPLAGTMAAVAVAVRWVGMAE